VLLKGGHISSLLDDVWENGGAMEWRPPSALTHLPLAIGVGARLFLSVCFEDPTRTRTSRWQGQGQGLVHHETTKKHCTIYKMQTLWIFHILGGVLLPALRAEYIFEKRTQNENLTIRHAQSIRVPVSLKPLV